jgi:hypothetical protein
MKIYIAFLCFILSKGLEVSINFQILIDRIIVGFGTAINRLCFSKNQSIFSRNHIFGLSGSPAAAFLRIDRISPRCYLINSFNWILLLLFKASTYTKHYFCCKLGLILSLFKFLMALKYFFN